MKHRFLDLWPEDDALQIAEAVAEDDEAQLALLAPVVDPTTNGHFLFGVVGEIGEGEPARLSVALPPARRDQILLLDAEGLDAVEIARRMEMDVCDVRLVLNLQRTRQQAPPPRA